jgi:hypothetical protein
VSDKKEPYVDLRTENVMRQHPTYFKHSKKVVTSSEALAAAVHRRLFSFSACTDDLPVNYTSKSVTACNGNGIVQYCRAVVSRESTMVEMKANEREEAWESEGWSKRNMPQSSSSETH